MKSKILSILFGAFAVILSACSTDIAPEPDAPSGKDGCILRLDIQKQDLTRGVITSTSFEKGDSVFVVVTDTQHPDPLTFTSAAVYDGEKWILKEKIDLSAETYGVGWTSATVEVYYPYETFFQVFNQSSQTEIILKDPLDQEDILYGRATAVNAENPSAKITCGHLKSRLSFELKNNSDSPVGITRMSVTTEGHQLFLGRYGYIRNGNFIIPDEYTEDYSMNCNIEVPAGETTTLDFLIPPTEAAYEMMQEKMELDGISETTLKFSLDARSRTINFDIDAKPWAAGQQYTYPVTLFYERKPIPDTDEYVDLGLSVLWAKCNLGTDKPEGTGKFFFWSDIKGYEIGESYTQDICSYVNNKTPEELFNENIVVEDQKSLVSRYKYHLAPQYDAATQNLGQPWRMPTADEIYEFKENTKMEWYMVEGQWMFKFTSTVPGYEDRYIIMPGQTGCFNGYYSEIKYIDSFSNTSNPAGVWWGSSASDDTERAYGFNIAWGVGNPVKYDNPRNSLLATFRTWGHPVRAVRPLRAQ